MIDFDQLSEVPELNRGPGNRQLPKLCIQPLKKALIQCLLEAVAQAALSL